MTDPLEQFRETLEQALYHAEMNSELIRVRPLLRRALNVTNEVSLGTGRDETEKRHE